MVRQITVLVVDDVPAVRRGLHMRLAREADLDIVGEAEDGLQAIDLARELRPDVVLLDVAMPGQDGIATADQLRTLVPDSAVIMLSLYDDAQTRVRATAAGAATVVGKHEPVAALLAVIRQTARSQSLRSAE